MWVSSKLKGEKLVVGSRIFIIILVVVFYISAAFSANVSNKVIDNFITLFFLQKNIYETTKTFLVQNDLYLGWNKDLYVSLSHSKEELGDNESKCGLFYHILAAMRIDGMTNIEQIADFFSCKIQQSPSGELTTTVGVTIVGGAHYQKIFSIFP